MGLVRHMMREVIHQEVPEIERGIRETKRKAKGVGMKTVLMSMITLGIQLINIDEI